MKKGDIGRTIDSKGTVNHLTYKYPTVYVSDTHHLALAHNHNHHNYVVLPNSTILNDYNSHTNRKPTRFANSPGHLGTLPP